MKNILVILFLVLVNSVFAQGYLHVNGKQIVDGDGNNVILRGMGLGGWMLQEGYMMKTASFANAQFQIKEKIENVIGTAKTIQFYDAWLENYVQKVDVDSLKSWGFNSIRLPLHYNLFTLPIEEEPIKTQNTWLDKGFDLTDRLLGWCAENEIYLILDMHAAPGGQGYESGISDYDPSKPSLWESEYNQNKLVALWQKLAERYANESWIGGYDLINETNWNMNNNKPLKDLSVTITNAIREVDQNHIIYIEGNWFANDFTGMTPPWDDNMVYSFHKYWSVNDQASIQWMLDMRNRHNIPIWCGEAGENSNVWFTEAIKLLEEHNIGWAWWAYKKIEEIDGPLSIETSYNYDRLLSYWNGETSKPSLDAAFKGLMDLTDNLLLENCIYQKDVIDAMFRQVQTTETIPFAEHFIPGLIFASDYDLGTNGYAYWDEQVATYHVTTDNYTSWNNGWVYRNDGVDIQACEDDDATNGYNVGWIGTDEWLTYTVNIDETAAYDVTFRVATESATGKVHLQLDGRPVSTVLKISNTGGWQNWASVKASGIILQSGQHVLKLYFDSSTFNLNFVEFDNPQPTENYEFTCLSAEITDNGYSVLASFNKKLPAALPTFPGGFVLTSTGEQLAVNSYELDASGYQILFALKEQLHFEDLVYLSYSGNALTAQDGTKLQAFDNLRLKNNLDARHSIPGKIQAEDFIENNGFELENTSDSGGGQNLGYSDVGDYADYLVTINKAGIYAINYRTASESNGGGLELQLIDGDNVQKLHTVNFPATGGWQNWTTTSGQAILPQGRYTLRIKVTKSLFNLNWMNFQFTGTTNVNGNLPFQFELAQNYPNPFNPSTTISYEIPETAQVTLNVFDIRGRLVKTLVNSKQTAGAYKIEFSADELPSGAFFYQLKTGQYSQTRKMLLIR